MSFSSILNLYKDQTVLMMRECYALEKVHGSSAWITLKRGNGLVFFPGGESEVNFRALFDYPAIKTHLEALGCEEVFIYGEVYGGSVQHMSPTYGDRMAFVVFDIKIDGLFLCVPQMAELAASFGLDVVPFERIPTDMAAIDQQRDAPSVVSRRRGIAEPKPREGVVLRPLIELTKNNGERVIAKHKTEKHSERKIDLASCWNVLGPHNCPTSSDPQGSAPPAPPVDTPATPCDPWLTAELGALISQELFSRRATGTKAVSDAAQVLWNCLTQKNDAVGTVMVTRPMLENLLPDAIGQFLDSAGLIESMHAHRIQPAPVVTAEALHTAIDFVSPTGAGNSIEDLAAALKKLGGQ